MTFILFSLATVAQTRALRSRGSDGLGHLRARDFPQGKCDDEDMPGSGSRLFYINSWAMQWATDHPIRSSAADWAAETL